MHQSQLSAMYDGQFESVYLDSLEDCLPCEPGWTAICKSIDPGVLMKPLGTYLTAPIGN